MKIVSNNKKIFLRICFYITSSKADLHELLCNIYYKAYKKRRWGWGIDLPELLTVEVR